ATSLVARDRQASAIAPMVSGLALAPPPGVPAGARLGLPLAWQAPSWPLTAVGLVAMAAVAPLRPPPRRHAPPGGRRPGRPPRGAGAAGAGDHGGRLRRRVRGLHLHRTVGDARARLCRFGGVADPARVRRGDADRQPAGRPARGPPPGAGTARHPGGTGRGAL